MEKEVKTTPEKEVDNKNEIKKIFKEKANKLLREDPDISGQALYALLFETEEENK